MERLVIKLRIGRRVYEEDSVADGQGVRHTQSGIFLEKHFDSAEGGVRSMKKLLLESKQVWSFFFLFCKKATWW